jgi:hypothetical protein
MLLLLKFSLFFFELLFLLLFVVMNTSFELLIFELLLVLFILYRFTKFETFLEHLFWNKASNYN